MKAKTMFQTKRMIIRLIELEDLEILRQMHNEENTLFWLTDIFHVSIEEQKAWFSNMSLSRKNRRYTVLSRESNEIIGVVRLDKIDLVNKNAEIGVDIAPDYRRQGYAREIYECMFDYTFNALNLHRLSLVCLETNTTAQALYYKIGFKKEGVLTESILRNGEYKNLVCMFKLNLNL